MRLEPEQWQIGTIPGAKKTATETVQQAAEINAELLAACKEAYNMVQMQINVLARFAPFHDPTLATWQHLFVILQHALVKADKQKG